jgi:hypothetical protein
MGENTSDAIETLSMVIIFLSALSIVFVMWTKASQVNTYVNQNTTSRNITTNLNDTGTYDSAKRNILTKYDVANEIIAHKEDGIKIYLMRGGRRVEIAKANYATVAALTNASGAALPDMDYARTYETDENGNVLRIIYKEAD